jgi:hypothetical protein
MKEWNDFLCTQNIQPLQQNNVLCALTETGLLYVGGDDATDFLQNQLSNDIRLIDDTGSQISSCSSSKGRVYGIFRVVRIEGGYLLLMPHSILPSVQERLQKFIIMSKVVMADITNSFSLFSVTTDNDELLAEHNLPENPGEVYQSDTLISLQLHSAAGRKRFLLMSNNAQEAIQLWSELASYLVINDMTHWRLQEIEAGIPSIHAATSEAFVLQMCNLDALGGVSFKKGCYPGQEVVARMHYLGKLKRRMYLAELQSTECPLPGDEITSQGSVKNDGSGKVVDAVQIETTKCLMLFVAQIAKAQAGELLLATHPESKLTLKSLPYAIPA